MSEVNMKSFDEDFALFIEAGFVAVKQVDEPSARKLFYAAEAIRPDHPAPLVGLGYIALNRLEVKEAVEYFKEVLEMDPDYHLARAFLGIAYLLKKTTRKEGYDQVKQAMKETDDETVKNLCEKSLEWADKDLKEKKAPFFS